jgi:hypothetical protein
MARIVVASTLPGRVQGSLSVAARTSSTAFPRTTLHSITTGQPYLNNQLAKRDKPSLGTISGYNDVAPCAVNCLGALVSYYAIPPAADCKDYVCLCHNEPAGILYLGFCYSLWCTSDSTDLPRLTSIFSVYCATTSANAVATQTSQSFTGSSNSGGNPVNSTGQQRTGDGGLSTGGSTALGTVLGISGLVVSILALCAYAGSLFARLCQG